MKVSEIVDAMERFLPCPPHPMPERGTDADYLWRATLFNASQDPPWFVVKFPEYQPLPHVYKGETAVQQAVVKTITVECDRRGRGVKVIR